MTGSDMMAPGASPIVVFGKTIYINESIGIMLSYELETETDSVVNC